MTVQHSLRSDEPFRTRAYALNVSKASYGREAIDTLVSKVHNKPGDDIAVIMCGYEDQMKQVGTRNLNFTLYQRWYQRW